jgi:hypothetical protein
MSVPTNLIPSPITGLQEYTGTSTLGYLPYVLEGRSYKVQFANIAAVGAVPSSRVIAAGTGLAGGGDLTTNRVISIANGGVGFDQLASSGVTQGTYGSGSAIPILTVDAKGRVTSATTAALDVTGFVPTSRTITAGDGLTGGGSLANNISLAANFSAATPSALGTASAGTAITVSRGDHVHPAVNLSDTSQTQGALPLGRGGTGDALSPVAGAVVYSTGTKFALTNPGIAGQVLVSGGTDEPQWRTVEGAGTVTSVNASGGATGLSFTGGPITVSGTLTLGGTLAVANGGTGASTAGTARTNLGAAASGANTDITSIALTTGTISTSPVNGTDIVNKVYADSIASGINFHQSVRLATAAALPANTYNNGASGVGATLTGNANGALSVDGVAAVAGNRILVKNEVTQANNGVYTVTQVGSGAAPYILTRATDFDSAGTGVDQIDAGDFFLVTAGSTQANTSWVQQTPLPIVVGTTALVFTQFAAPVLYSAGTGLTLAGTVFSLTAPVTVALGGTGATTLSSGYLVKGNGTSAVSASLVYDNGTNVGIGTASPARKLDVNGSIRVGDAQALEWGGTAYAIVGDNAGAMIFKTASSERMRIDSIGNVGIGTASPAYRLHVTNTSGYVAAFRGTTAANSGILVGNTAGDTSVQTLASGDGFIFSDTGKYLAFGANGASEKMRITSAGNVGIGASAPATRLHVEGADTELRVQSTTSSNGYIRFLNTSGSMSIGMSGAATNTLLTYDRTNSQTVHEYLGGASGYHYWATNGTERMRITNTGNVGIGTASPRAVTNYTNIGISGTSGSFIDFFTGATRYGTIFGTSASLDVGTPTATPLTLTTNATERMRILSGGNVGIGTTTPAQKLSVAGTIESTTGGVIVPDQLAYDYATSNLPTTRPALSLDFADVGALDPRVTFTRASTATFTGSNGLIQTAAINAPRFDYDPVTLAPKGLLIEEQRTNITFHSGVTAANWSTVGGTIANTGKTSPDGTSQMGLFTEDTASSSHIMFVNPQPAVIVSGTTYTASIYLAAGTRRYVVVNAGGSGSGWGVTVDTVNWTFNGYSVGGGVFQSATITPVGNGIYRVTVTGNQFAGGGISAYVVVSGSLVSSATRVDTAYLGDGSTFYAWGAQFEAGAFATSYIPTVASQVTRSGDDATMTGTNFSSWYNQSEGSFVLEATGYYPAASVVRQPLTVSDGTASNYARIYTYDAFFSAQITTGGVTQADMLVSGAYTQNVTTKFAMALQTNNSATCANGGSVVTDTSCTLPTVNRMALGYFTAGQNFNGHIRSITYYNTRLPNAVLQGITS